MQETIEKRKEKLKHNIAIKPVFKPKSKEGIKERKEIPVKAKTEKFEGQQKVKAGFVSPATVGQEVEGRKTNLPLFGPKQATKISASEEKMKSTAMAIKVKREVKEHLKGSVEELLSEPQKLKALSSEIEEPKETRVKTNFDSSIPPIEPEEIEKPLEVPEIKLINFTPSTTRMTFDDTLSEIKQENRFVTIPKLSITKPSEVITKNSFEKEVSSRVISKIKEKMVEVEEKVEEINESGNTAGGEPETIENIIDELFISLKGGSCLKWKLTRPLCILLTGDKQDGMKTIEDLISTKYTFHGFYDFSKNLPWQEVVKDIKAGGKLHKPTTLKREEVKIYDKIISEDLIVSDVIGVNDKDEIIKGLRDISNRGAKCVVFYTQDSKDFENLDLEIANVDVKLIRLPKLDEDVKKLISKLVGVDLETLDGSVDSLWRRAVRFYEEEAEELDRKLPSKDVDYFPERETGKHYLMKKIAYHYLKNKNEYKDKEIKVEEPIILDDERKPKEIIPDIIVNKAGELIECWEVETGYPSKDEEAWIKEPFSPYARLVWKLKKYGEGGHKKVNVVIPSIYAYLFIEDIRKVKEYFEGKFDKLRFYTLHWYKKAGIRFFT